MKKSVVILIGIIYIASIVFVGFFGMKLKAFSNLIYITDIECTNENLIYLEGEDVKIIEFDFKEGGSELENSIIITYKVFPENSTLRGSDAVRMFYDIDTTIAKVDGLTITFLDSGSLIVYLQSLDGSNIIETIEIIAE